MICTKQRPSGQRAAAITLWCLIPTRWPSWIRPPDRATLPVPPGAGGQAWAVYSFLLSYLHTGKKEYLETAAKVGDYFISQVQEDWIPRCDFRQPDGDPLEDACYKDLRHREGWKNSPDRVLELQIDGFAGLLVAVFILKTGWEAAKDTLDPLLGRPMDPALAKEIDRLAVEHPNILAIHDLVYHDYGPGRAMMSFHAEVPADADLLDIHDMIDNIEREMKARYHIETVIHMDPVVNDDRTRTLREQVAQLACTLDRRITIHDLRITAGPRHTNVLFDMVLPYGSPLGDSQAKEQMGKLVRQLDKRYHPVIQVDHSFIEDQGE